MEAEIRLILADAVQKRSQRSDTASSDWPMVVERTC